MVAAAATLSAGLSSGGNSQATGSPFRAGARRSMHRRMAAISPCFAISIALRPIASASSANKLSISSVARLREPRPAGRISALTLLKRHGLSLSVVARKYAARGRGLRARNKKPGAVSRPGGWRTFGEYAFLEDSRYASQEDFAGNLVWRRFLRL